MRAAPNPRTLSGRFRASPHVLRVSPAGFPPVSRLPAGFFPLRPPSSGFPSSGVLRFGPFGRCSVPVSLRIPFPRAIFTLALPRAGHAGVGPRRQGPMSPVLPRPPHRDHAIRPPYRWAAAGHDGMPPQNRLLRAAARAGHHRTRTAQIGGSRAASDVPRSAGGEWLAEFICRRASTTGSMGLWRSDSMSAGTAPAWPR